jgi:hypothetical protein
MAGNIQADTSGNILVEFDYDSIIVVDPNKTIDDFGNIKDRLVDHENLVMYANLEADVLPRTKLAVGISPQDSGFETISVAKINFLKPTKNSYLGTGYYDQLTGENTTQGKGVNQPSEITETSSNGVDAYIRNSVVDEKDIIDTGLLGITSINIQTNSSFVPQVDILLEDVQGKGLFELGDNSPYSAFFNLPYPQFYLTLKGYYGQAVRYQLNLEKFHASFNGFSGNYIVRLTFKGYKFNILNEISMGHLLAAPHMYSQRFDITQTVEGPQQSNKAAESQASTQAEKGANNLGSNQAVVTQIVAEKGYQKIVEVYSEYKAKGLIEPNFPELTLVQLMTKLEKFEDNIMQSFDKVEVASLTNVRNYKGDLTKYFSAVRGSNTSWFSINLDPKPFVLKSGAKLYVFKKISREQKNTAIEQLKKIITESNSALAENATLGVRGLTPIPNPIKYDMLTVTPPQSTDINWRETTRLQTGIVNPTLQDEVRVQSSVSSLFIPIEIEQTNQSGAIVGAALNILNSSANLVPQEWFVFEGDGRFDSQIALLESQANKKLADYESEITALLLRKIEDTATGIGFKPTVRNMIAVIMASAEGFIRLMDEVHTNAWAVKYDPVRYNAILENPSSAQSSETVDLVVRDPLSLMNENQMDSTAVNSQIPVYPWPQFFVETNEDGEPKFQLKYIADPTVVDLTQGYLFDKWPEVEFVEEYMKGLTQKFQNPNAPPPLDNERDTNVININAIEYPSIGLAYSNKEEVKFFYEIWERQFITSHYSGLIRANLNQVDELIKLNIETEVNNIVTKLGISSPYLSLKLKNFNLNATNYPEFLRTISNSGTGRAYQDYIRDFFVTPYLRGITENSFAILSTLDLGKIPQASTKSEALRSLIVNDSNTPLIVDTLPYTNPTWCLNNLNQGNTAFSNQVYNTNKSLTIFEPRKIIANFTDVYNYTFNRPVTNFSYLVNQNPTSEVIAGLNFFYISRFPDKFIPTEGYVNGTYPTNNSALTSLGSNIFRTTTSMLNTPYFVNAIQNGVYNSRISGNTYPYVQAAYLFLNSLPLATLREKYKSYENNVTTDLDYISSALKKFGAIHKLPYAWILKYGSIWHRYKKYKESNVDILQSAWTNFNYEENYYPPTSSTTKVYFFQYNGSTTSIQLQSEGVADIGMQVGFYPKLINDFNVFYNGYDLYQNYTDKEIQQSVNAGMKLYNFSDSNIVNAKQGDKNLRLSTWSVVLPNTTPELPIDCNPNDNTKGSDYFVVPSFGTSLNQSVNACIQNVTTTPTTKVDLSNNPSVYNGSVRCLWSAPNYGYFDGNQLAFPQPDSYLNFITTGSTVQTPFHFLTQDDYTKIEEVFSVFEKKILDSFELEFLNFCKSINNATGGVQNITFGQSPVDMDANFRNFQSLFKSLMTVPVQLQGETDEQYFTNTINSQYSLFQNGIKSFMEYDVIFKYGNPSNYQRRIFDSYLSHNNVDEVVDPITFNPYVPNSLPQLGSDLTLGQSQANNREAWTALETEVGFSTIPNVRYSSFGSYITDFFIDNNIEFTSQNVTLLAPIIKMFATQKLNNPSITASQFQTQLGQYLQRETSLQNNFLNGVLTGVRNSLPDQQQLPERVINSVITGDQSKVENYEVFKALNDKWIAGGDYTTKTLFEDFLFLDRASRNIGDKILIDIFALKKVFNSESLNQAMSVFTFVSGILIRNNFTVMPLPSYVNFYNVQEIDGTEITKPEGSLEFANNLWGTFLNVDYRKSSSKFVCFFVGKPSQYPNLPKKNSKYRSDAFEMRRASGNPLLSQLPFTQRDRALSNRCVGFNVDVGTRNQNIFYSLTVSQDNGNATSESINIQIDMSNQATGRAVATQNTGLYNYYKNRSYKATVTSLGNALIQPTMYFNLRHVPMFEGSYMITNVTHSIQPGSFQTTFDGVRQGFFDLPTIDSLLQSINQNLVTKLEEILKINKDQVKDSATTNNVKSTEVVQAADNTLDTTNSCSSKITAGAYLNAIPGYVAEVGTFTAITPTEFATALKRVLPNEPDLRTLIYSISYIRTFQESSNTKQGTFNGWNNNFGTLSLSVDWQGQVQLFPRVYSCVNIRTNPSTSSSQPIIHFESLDNYINFMAGRLRGRVNQILEPNMGLAKYYVCHWPVDNISEQYFDNNINEFNQTIETFKKALASAKSVDLLDVDKLLEYKKPLDDDANNDKTPGVTPTPTVIPPNEGQTCPPPVVTTFSPSAGFTGTIVQVNGRNFESVESITVAGQNVDINNITVFNSETLRFILPAIIIPEGQDVATGRIIVKTKFGTFQSLVDFTFNPALQNTTTSSPGGYEDTKTTEVIPVSEQENVSGSANLQETMLNPPMFISEKIDNELGTEILTVKVDQNDYVGGVWKIEPQVEYSYIIDLIEVGPNNTVTRTSIETSESSKLLGFVSSDGQTFSITRQQFIDAEFSEVLEMEKGKRLEISTSIYLRARPENREKNPKDDTKSVRFRMIVPSSETGVQPQGSLSFIQRSTDVTLPSFQGPLYYNIRRPDGGFITYRFNCPLCKISKVFVAEGSKQTIPLNITITNNPDTKYTNVIDVNSSGRFVLSVIYENADNSGTFTATSNPFTL